MRRRVKGEEWEEEEERSKSRGQVTDMTLRAVSTLIWDWKTSYTEGVGTQKMRCRFSSCRYPLVHINSRSNLSQLEELITYQTQLEQGNRSIQFDRLLG